MLKVARWYQQGSRMTNICFKPGGDIVNLVANEKPLCRPTKALKFVPCIYMQS